MSGARGDATSAHLRTRALANCLELGIDQLTQPEVLSALEKLQLTSLPRPLDFDPARLLLSSNAAAVRITSILKVVLLATASASISSAVRRS